MRLLLTWASLTKSISSLEVSCNVSYKPEQQKQKKQNFLALSKVAHSSSDPEDVPEHIFSDLLPVHILYNTPFNIILNTQHSSLPSNSQIDSILSAPPPWNLHVDT